MVYTRSSFTTFISDGLKYAFREMNKKRKKDSERESEHLGHKGVDDIGAVGPPPCIGRRQGLGDGNVGLLEAVRRARRRDVVELGDIEWTSQVAEVLLTAHLNDGLTRPIKFMSHHFLEKKRVAARWSSQSDG